MKIRFYFDYSDYRSYLMLHTLKVLDDIPVEIEWIALDAYSLRALSGCEAPMQSPGEREYLKQEALRFCKREGLEFVWQPERFHSGSALRAGIWLMFHRSPEVENFSRHVLDIMWGRGKNIDATSIREILTNLDIAHEAMFQQGFEREYFQFQDACLQEALNDGVFDVPAVVIGNQMVCHFDMGHEIRRLAVLECLRELPKDAIYNAFASHLLSLGHDAFSREFAGLMRQSSVRQSVRPIAVHPIGAIQHSLSVPDAVWHIAKYPVRENFACHVCPVGGFKPVMEGVTAGILNIVRLPDVEWNDELISDIPHLKLPTLIVLQCMNTGVLIRSDGNGKIYADKMGDCEIKTSSIYGWTVAVLNEQASCDLNMGRLASHLGAHILIRMSSSGAVPFSEALGYAGSCWIIEMGADHIDLIDSESHRMHLESPSTTSLEVSFKLKGAPLWNPAAPRTLLLFDSPVTFGELTADADIELACRGMNLLVTTAQQSSELSSTRVFEKLRIRNHVILLLPLYGEQIFVTELVSHRIVETLNQAPKETVPIFVNFWNELEFEMLESMRPVMSVLASTFNMPVILVVGSQVAEIWLPNSQGAAWRVEKEDDCYTIDIEELARAGAIFERMLDFLGVDEATFLSRMQQIEQAAKG